jgi:hypothetical protein
MELSTSAVPIVSRTECIDSEAIPTSTVRMPYTRGGRSARQRPQRTALPTGRERRCGA